jgi:hypothetical protein
MGQLGSTHVQPRHVRLWKSRVNPGLSETTGRAAKRRFHVRINTALRRLRRSLDVASAIYTRYL